MADEGLDHSGPGNLGIFRAADRVPQGKQSIDLGGVWRHGLREKATVPGCELLADRSFVGGPGL